ENSPVPLPGFAEHVVGLEKNQEKEFTISFPADHGVAELAGKQYHFKVKVSEVKEKHLPEMNDDFAKSAGNNVETVEALRKLVAERLQQASEKRAEAAFQEKVVDAVVGLAKVEFPPIMVEREVDRLLQERDNLLSRQGGLEAYLRTIQKTEKELREEVRPQATTQIARALVLGKLAEDEKIEVGAADIDSEIEEMTKDAANRAGEVRSVFDAPQGRRWISDRLLTQKTVRRLAEIAVGGVQEVVVQQAVNEQVAGSKSNAVADG
ncbi:MAG: trigger factor, partial [Chloroflexi bacterium]|nr:trigger factor [Chloroflexota bacterium]